MKKYWVVVLLLALFVAGMWFIKNHYDQEGRTRKEYEKENAKLKLLADRREMQFRIATYESQLKLRDAKPVTAPADPNE